MKKLFFIILAAAVFTGCSKDKSDPGTTPAVTGIKVKTQTAGASISQYTFDNQGRAVLISRSNGSKTQYTYAPGLITEEIYNNAGVYQYSYKYELNAGGNTFRTTTTNNPNYELLDQYNPDGTLAKSISNISGSSSVIDFFYSNGNCDSARFSGNNGWFLTIKKTYYTDKPNVLGDDVYGYAFYGKNNKNLQKSEVYTYPDGSSLTPLDYTYEFDGSGRVIKRTGTKGSNIEITLITYY